MTSLEYTDSSSVVHRTEYRYSGDGFLAEIKKYENSALVDTVRIVRDGFLALQDRDGSNNVVREYTWGLNLGGGIGGLLNLKQGGQDYAYLYDGKGNVAAVLDASQAVVAAYRYAPFGKLLAKTGSLTQPFGFSTKRYDAQAGLIHYQYRSYAPEIGRWLTRDPLGEEGGMNLYAFVGNNPVNWVDPLGLELRFTGPDALKEKASELFEKAKQEANEALKIKIQEIEENRTICIIPLVYSDGNVITGSYSTGKIDLADIEAFPDTGAATKTGKLMHEIVEQWEKQKYGQPYGPAHQKASKAEEDITGWARGAQGPVTRTRSGGLTTYIIYTKGQETKRVTYITDSNGNLTIQISP